MDDPIFKSSFESCDVRAYHDALKDTGYQEFVAHRSKIKLKYFQVDRMEDDTHFHVQCEKTVYRRVPPFVGNRRLITWSEKHCYYAGNRGEMKLDLSCRLWGCKLGIQTDASISFSQDGSNLTREIKFNIDNLEQYLGYLAWLAPTVREEMEKGLRKVDESTKIWLGKRVDPGVFVDGDFFYDPLLPEQDDIATATTAPSPSVVNRAAIVSRQDPPGPPPTQPEPEHNAHLRLADLGRGCAAGRGSQASQAPVPEQPSPRRQTSLGSAKRRVSSLFRFPSTRQGRTGGPSATRHHAQIAPAPVLRSDPPRSKPQVSLRRRLQTAIRTATTWFVTQLRNAWQTILHWFRGDKPPGQAVLGSER